MDDATSEQITINVPGNVIAQIGAQVGGDFVDRDEFIRAAVRPYIEALQAGMALRG